MNLLLEMLTRKAVNAGQKLNVTLETVSTVLAFKHVMDAFETRVDSRKFRSGRS